VERVAKLASADGGTVSS